MQDPIVALQHLLPQPWLARTFGKLARSERPWVRDLLIRLWIRAFDVSLADAARSSPDDYVSFEDFFTRELRPDARPQPADSRALVSPADGSLHEFGAVNDGKLVQAKGIEYTLEALLGDDLAAEPFRGGWYATIYLSPADYHRIHVPCDAVLRTAIAIPGQAYSVTGRTERALPDLFCRNERLACVLDTRVGPMALVMVGAMLVAGI
jgi:phosphatidylserine decarboxylase